MKKRHLLLTLLLALFVPWAAMGQTVTIGTGSNTYASSPIDNYYNYSFTEILYTAADIAAGEPTYNNIVSMGFESDNGANGYAYGITVYMKNVEDAAFGDSFITVSNADVVFTGTVTPTAGWVTFTLDNNFTYDNTKNLLVAVNKTSGYKSGSTYQYAGSSYKWKHTTTTANTVILAHNDGSAYNLTTSWPTTMASAGSYWSQTARPNVQLTFAAPPAYPKPTNVRPGTVTGETAEILWDAPQSQNTPSSYTYNYKKQNEEYWSSEGTAYSTSANIGDLDENTDYDFRVKAWYGSNPSEYATTTFTTPCGAKDIPYSYGFEEADKFECWTPVSGNVTRMSGTAYNGSNYRLDFRGSASNMIALPSMGEATNTLRIELYTRPESTSSSCGKFSVGYMTDPADASTFHAIKTYNYSDWGSTVNYEKRVVDFNDPTDNVPAGAYIALRHHDCSSSYYWYVDDVTVKVVPACAYEVAGLAVNGISQTSATATWTNGDPGEWQVALKAGDGEWTTLNSTYTTNSASLPSLTAGTDYQVKVRAYCSASAQGDWCEPVSFTTYCSPITVTDTDKLDENFDDMTTATSSSYYLLPDCWKSLNGTSYSSSAGFPSVRKGSSNANSGDNYLYFYSYYYTDPKDQYAILTPVDNVNELRIKLSARRYSTSYSAAFIIGVMNDPTDASTFTAVSESLEPDGTTYQNFIVAFDTYTGSGQWIAIKMPCSTTTSKYLYIDDVLVEPIPSCLEPALGDPTGITATTATLHWTQAGSVSSWNIRWRENGTTGEYQTATSNTTSYQITTGLSGNKTYEYGVQAGCGSNWSDGTFTTSCPEFNDVPFTQNFDGIAGSTSNTANNLPQCWDYINASTYSSNKNYPIVYSGSSYYYNSPNSLKFYITQYYSSNDPQPQYAILPPVENVNGLRVKLYARAYSTGYSYTNTFKVGVMEGTDVSTFETIETITPTSTTYKEYIIPFDSYTGEGTRIAILMEVPSTDYAGAYIDNITVEQLPDCATPTGLAANNTTPEGATIAWTGGEGTEWTVQYKKAAESEWTTVTPNVTETTYTFTGLDFSTSYQARVSVVCTEGTGITYPTNPVSFTTQVQFPAPTNLVASNLTLNSATLSWTPGYTNQTAWKVQYKKSSDSWTDAATIVNTPTLDIPDGLEENTTYNVRIYGGIGENFGTSYLTGNFTTKWSQGAPTDLVVNVTANSATLSWTPGYTTQDHWTVKYKKSSVSSWDDATTEDVTEPTIPLENLDGMTKYDVQIYYVEANKLTGSFTTAGAFPYTEDFTNVSNLTDLTGWNVYNGQLDETEGTATLVTGYGWSTSSNTNFSGEYHIYSNVYSTGCYKWAVSPTLYCSAEASVKFDLALTKYTNENNQPTAVDPTQQQDDKFIVLITKDNGANWTQLAKWDNAGSDRVYNEIATLWETVTLNINESYAGEYIRIAFYGESTLSGGDNNVHVDNIEIDIVQDCDKPVLTLDDYAATTADFSWSAGESSTTWTLNYKKTTDEEWTVITDIETNHYQIPELTPEQAYEVRVLASCNIYWSNTVTFTTTASCVAPVLSLTAGSETAVGATVTWTGDNDSYVVEYREVITPAVVLDTTYGFEDNTLQGWTSVDEDGNNKGWYISSGAAYNSTYCAAAQYNSSEVPSDWLISPQIPLGGTLSFYAKKSSGTEQFQVYVSTTGTDISNFTAISDVENPTSTYTLYEYDLSDYSGNGYVAILHTGAVDQYWLYVDDITYTNHIDGEYGEWQQVSDANPTSPYTFDILDEETTYEVRVKGVCGSDESDYSNVVSFTTLESCPAPMNFTLGAVTSSTAAFSWTQLGDITEWHVWVKESTDAEYPTDYITVSNTPSVTIDENLTGSTTYDVMIAPACDHDKYLEVEEAFTTACDIVTVDATHQYTQDFSSWIPLCWELGDAVTVSNYNWAQSSGRAYSGYYGTIDLYMPTMNIAGDNAMLTFQSMESATSFYTGGDNDAGGLNIVKISTDNGSTWTQLWCPTIDELTPTFRTVNIGLQNYVNQDILIAFEYQGDNAHGWYIDDVEVKAFSVFTKEITGNTWYFIASPVGTAPTNMDDLSDLYFYDEQNHFWRNKKVHEEGFDFALGKGYLAANAVVDGPEPEAITLTFTGAPITGDTYNVPVTYNAKTSDNEDNPLAGWNLVGNPFACNATVDRPFFTVSGKTLVAFSANTSIAPCEGVMVQAAAIDIDQNTINYENYDEEVIFTKVNSSTPVQPNQLQMTVAQQVVNRNGVSAEIIDNAIVSFDKGNLLEKFVFNADLAKLYIPQDNKEFAIISSEGQGEMPVNFRANENGSYTITVNAEGVDMAYLHLIDNKTGNDINLLQTPSYTFNATTTDYESRFKLVFCTGVNDDSDNFAFCNNGNWIISNEGNATLQVIDITGRILNSETVNGSVSKAIQAAPGVYMLRLINGDNVKVQKIVVR